MIFDNKEFILGSWINSGSPIIAEIMSASKFDFLVVDAEHSAVDLKDCQNLFRAIKAGNNTCIPMVRMPGNKYHETKRYLDAGAMGIIAPLINNGEQAQLLVNSVKYPPHGQRGVGYGRSHGYGFAFENYMKTANEDIFICVQIEHIDAVDNIDEILSIPGIHAAFIGPYDLSASMGLTAKFDHPEYLKVINNIKLKCQEYDIYPGIHVVQPDPKEMEMRLEDGFKMIAYSLDITMLGNTCLSGVHNFQSTLNN